MRVDSFIRNHSSIIHVLRSKQRYDPKILALIFSECYFSNKRKRTLEYFAWFFLSLINSKRRFTLSIGISQVQIKHWINYGILDDRFSFPNLMKVLDPIQNYDIVEKYIISHSMDSDRPIKIIAAFRGESRLHHVTLYQKLHKIFSPIQTEYLRQILFDSSAVDAFESTR